LGVAGVEDGVENDAEEEDMEELVAKGFQGAVSVVEVAPPSPPELECALTRASTVLSAEKEAEEEEVEGREEGTELTPNRAGSNRGEEFPHPPPKAVIVVALAGSVLGLRGLLLAVAVVECAGPSLSSSALSAAANES